MILDKKNKHIVLYLLHTIILGQRHSIPLPQKFRCRCRFGLSG